jgi:Uma2 family endonuclease
MAIIAPQPRVKSKGRLLTIADVAALPRDLPSGPMKYELDDGRLVSEPFTIADVAVLPRQLPSGPVDYELDNGELIVMSPTGRRHGVVQGRISALLISLGDERGLGETAVETGIILRRNPDKLVGPDVSFWLKTSFPLNESSEGYVETIPELVFEVRSKNDQQVEIDEKVADYLKVGVKHVFVVDAAAATVVRHFPASPPAEFGDGDVLDLSDVLPDLIISLAELFRR